MLQVVFALMRVSRRAGLVRGNSMSRPVKTTGNAGGSERRPADLYEDLENEFLGIWLGLARLREKMRCLTARETAPAPQGPA